MHTLTIKVASLADMNKITDCIAEKLGIAVIQMDVGTETVVTPPKIRRVHKRTGVSKTQALVLDSTFEDELYSVEKIKSILTKGGWSASSSSPVMSKLVKQGHFALAGTHTRRMYKRLTARETNI